MGKTQDICSPSNPQVINNRVGRSAPFQSRFFGPVYLPAYLDLNTGLKLQ